MHMISAELKEVAEFLDCNLTFGLHFDLDLHLDYKH